MSGPRQRTRLEAGARRAFNSFSKGEGEVQSCESADSYWRKALSRTRRRRSGVVREKGLRRVQRALVSSRIESNSETAVERAQGKDATRQSPTKDAWQSSCSLRSYPTYPLSRWHRRRLCRLPELRSAVSLFLRPPRPSRPSPTSPPPGSPSSLRPSRSLWTPFAVEQSRPPFVRSTTAPRSCAPTSSPTPTKTLAPPAPPPLLHHLPNHLGRGTKSIAAYG